MAFKIMFASVCIFIFAITASGQHQETLIQGNVEHGFYIGQSTKLTEFDGRFEPMLGYRAAWILGHTVIIGAAGYSVLDKTETDFAVDGRLVELLPAYGGLQLFYVGNWHRSISYEIGTLIGFGGVNYSNQGSNSDLPNSDHIFVIEPEIILDLNVTKFLRISTGISYRWISGIDHEEVVKDSDLSGSALSLMLSFGKF